MRRQCEVVTSIERRGGQATKAWVPTPAEPRPNPGDPHEAGVPDCPVAHWNPDSEGFDKYDSARELDPGDVRCIRDQNEG